MTHDLILLVAYVRTARRASVGQSLKRLSVAGWSESAVSGHGRAAAGHAVEHTRFELVIPAQRRVECTEAIAKAGHTGEDGDGVVFALPVLSMDRISDFSSAPSSLET
jgi:nitrogen regulatory protein PII